MQLVRRDLVLLRPGIPFMTIQELASPQIRYVDRRMCLQLADGFLDCLLGRAQLRGHHGVACNKYAIFVVGRMNKGHQFGHAK